MSELISISAFNKLRLSNDSETVNDILALNGELSETGLFLTPVQAAELADTRSRALVDNERVELAGGGAVVKLIRKFSNSSYVDRSNFASLMNDLTEIFYYVKSETMDKVNDEVLIDTMFEMFETLCNGDVTLLGGRELDTLLRYFRVGKLKNRSRPYHMGEHDPYKPDPDDDYSDLSVSDRYDD